MSTAARVHIYGFGRSGTKGLQLWLAYGFARQFGAVRIQYEPFEFENRKLTPSASGRRAHRKVPIVCAPGERSIALDRFCARLRSTQPTVAKFIRANGRIAQLDERLSPALSLLVVRNVDEVLSSMASQTWSLFSATDDWPRVREFARRNHPFIERGGFLSDSSDRLSQFAVYWYVCNHAALKSTACPLVVRYGDWSLAYERVCRLWPAFSEIPALTTEMFSGENIHADYPLVDLQGAGLADRVRVPIQRALGTLHPRLREPFLGLMEYGRPLGTLCSIASSPDHGPSARSHVQVRVRIESHPVLVRMQEEIDALIDARMREQRSGSESRGALSPT